MNKYESKINKVATTQKIEARKCTSTCKIACQMLCALTYKGNPLATPTISK